MLEQNILEAESQNFAMPQQNNIGGMTSNLPLKPIKELFKNSIGLTWSKKWRFVFLNIIPKLLGILWGCIPLAIVILLYGILHFLFLKVFSNVNPLIPNIINMVLGILGILCLILGAFIYGLFWSQSAYINYLQTSEQSKKTILKNSRQKVWSLLVVNFLAGFAAYGYLLIYFCLACLWIIFINQSIFSLIILAVLFIIILIYSISRAIRFAYAPMAFLVEEIRGVGALRRSTELTLGYRWAIFKRSILFSYFQFIIQIGVSLLFALTALLFNFGGAIIFLGVLLFLIFFLVALFVGLLLEPLKLIYDFDIYHNLKFNKQNEQALEKSSFGQKIWILVLMFFLPLFTIAFSLLINFINPQKDTNKTFFSTLFNKVLPNSTPSNLLETDNQALDQNSENTLSEQQKAVEQLLTVVEKMTEAEALEINALFKDIYKNMPINTTKEDIPAYSETSFQLLVSLSGFDANRVNALSLEKKKFIWNSFQVNILKIQGEQEGLAKDSDMDGLNNEDEVFYKTDINNPDTDGDGYLDGEEVQNGYDPAAPGEAKLP